MPGRVAFQDEIATKLIPKLLKTEIESLYYSDGDIVKFKAEAIQEKESAYAAFIDDDESSEGDLVFPKTELTSTAGDVAPPSASRQRTHRRDSDQQSRRQSANSWKGSNPRDMRQEQNQLVDSAAVLAMLQNSDLYNEEKSVESAGLREPRARPERGARESRPKAEIKSRTGAAGRPARAPRTSRPTRNVVSIVDTSAKVDRSIASAI